MCERTIILTLFLILSFGCASIPEVSDNPSKKFEKYATQIIKGRTSNQVVSSDDAEKIAVAFVKKYYRATSLDKYVHRAPHYCEDIEAWIILFQYPLYPYALEGPDHFSVVVLKSGKVWMDGGR